MCIPNMVSKLSKIISHPQTILGWIPLRNDKLYISLGFYTNGHFWLQPTILDVYRIPFTHGSQVQRLQGHLQILPQTALLQILRLLLTQPDGSDLMAGFATSAGD